MRKRRVVLYGCFLIVVAIALLGYWMYKHKDVPTGPSNPWQATTIGEIPTPKGFDRVEGNRRYSQFLRSLPLKPKGSKVMLFTGGEARLQFLSAAVVDLPLLSNFEQCADVTMRIRAEYLYSAGRYNEIVFSDVNGNKLRYHGGRNRKSFEGYMRQVYGVCSTFSLSRETKTVRIEDVQPGDVWVYPARKGRKYGHAVMVVDVAKNKKGQIAIMCAEGNTPARNIHVIRNVESPRRNPWFILNGDESVVFISVFRFNADELRRY